MFSNALFRMILNNSIREKIFSIQQKSDRKMYFCPLKI